MAPEGCQRGWPLRLAVVCGQRSCVVCGICRTRQQLTIIATIFMPLSFLTGFFGMNFTSIPFDRRQLFLAALLVMTALPVCMLLFFLRRGWLSDDRQISTLARLRARLRRHR